MIRIVVIAQDKIHVLETFRHEYRSLMMLIYDKIYTESFGECKGMGRCGTCHIQLLNGSDDRQSHEGNENATLSKMALTTRNSRLACQMPVDERLDGLIVKIIVEGDS